MNRKSGKINRLEIPKPCAVSWENMVGDDKIRFCSDCNKQVHNLSAMTRNQADALLSASRGELCVRFTRHADGTTQFADEFTLPTPQQLGSRRAMPIASATLSAMLTISPLVTPQAHTLTNHPASILAADKNENSTATPQGASAKLSGSVQNVEKHPLEGITVTLTNENSGKVRQAVTDAEGVYDFAGLNSGVYILKIEAKGFEHYALHGINLMQRPQQNLAITLQPEITVMGAMGYTPDPLRKLYAESDRIVIATLGKSVKDKKDKSEVRTILNVTATLKGEAKDIIDFYDYDSPDRDKEFTLGDKVLVFLERRLSETGALESYALSSYRDAIRKLSDKELQGIAERLEQLAKLYEADQPDLNQVTEWLVRCVEDNVGRHDAAFEFADGARRLSYRKEEQEEEEAAKEEAGKEETQNENSNAEKSDPDMVLQQLNPIAQAETLTIQLGLKEKAELLSEREQLVLRLTAQQKERLMAVLFSAQETNDIEFNLVHLAIAWKDERLVPFLLAHLRQVVEKYNDGAGIVVSAFRDLDDEDEEITNLLEEYGEIESKILRAEAEESSAHKQEQSDEEEKFDKLEAIQKRTAALQKFLAAVEKKFTKKANQAKSESTEQIQK